MAEVEQMQKLGPSTQQMSTLLDHAPPAPEEEGQGPIRAPIPNLDIQAEIEMRPTERRCLETHGRLAFCMGRPSITARLTGAFSARVPWPTSGLKAFLGS